MEWEIYKNYINKNMNTCNGLRLIDDALSFTRNAINAFLTMNKKIESNQNKPDNKIVNKPDNKTISLSNMTKIFNLLSQMNNVTIKNNEHLYNIVHFGIAKNIITDHKLVVDTILSGISEPYYKWKLNGNIILVSLCEKYNSYGDIKYINICHTISDMFDIDQIIAHNPYILCGPLNYLINEIQQIGYTFIE